MAAPTGNKNAQRWTLQKTIDTLNFIDMCSFNDTTPTYGATGAANGEKNTKSSAS
jgi:hypothetical protein